MTSRFRQRKLFAVYRPTDPDGIDVQVFSYANSASGAREQIRRLQQADPSGFQRYYFDRLDNQSFAEASGTFATDEQVVTVISGGRMPSEGLPRFYERDRNVRPSVGETYDIGSPGRNFITTYTNTVSSNFVNTVANLREETIDLSTSRNQRIALRNRTNSNLTLANPVDGERYQFFIRQSDGGTGSLSWPPNVLWEGGQVYVATASSLATDLITLVYNGGPDEYYASFKKNFS